MPNNQMDTRFKQKKAGNSNAASIFDTSTIDMSAKGPSRVGTRTNKSVVQNPSTLKPKRPSKFDNGDESFSAREQDARLHPGNNLGYVNYINGVPVSI